MPERGRRKYALPAGQGVIYYGIEAAEIKEDGSLRLYRRRGPFGLLRRQDVFHPRGEWQHFRIDSSHVCTVTFAPKSKGYDGYEYRAVVRDQSGDQDTDGTFFTREEADIALETMRDAEPPWDEAFIERRVPSDTEPWERVT